MATALRRVSVSCIRAEGSAGNYTQSLLWVGQGTAGAASTGVAVWEAVALLLAMESSPAEPRRGPRSLGWPKGEHRETEDTTAISQIVGKKAPILNHSSKYYYKAYTAVTNQVLLLLVLQMVLASYLSVFVCKRWTNGSLIHKLH
jgi:hypothetical protein